MFEECFNKFSERANHIESKYMIRNKFSHIQNVIKCAKPENVAENDLN